MLKLSTNIKACDKCDISRQTKNKSIGRGAFNPKYLFVGLNPGREENETGRPFCGPSGKLLDRWVEYLGIQPEEYSVVNLIKCYTPNESELKGDEAAKCFPFLEEQIKILQPSYIIPLGAKPAQFLLNTKDGITKLAGRSFKKESIGPTYIPMTHPSYWLRRGGLGWETMLDTVKIAIDNTVSTSNSPSDIDGFREVKPIKFQKSITEGVDEKGSKGLMNKLSKDEKVLLQKYVPLHIHTTYSITDSATRLNDLARIAKRKGFNSLAITDHGTIGGWIHFQQECQQQNIKPIFGVEFYVANNFTNKDTERMHVVALAKNNEGLKSIFKLNNIAHTEGFYYKPRILLKHLIENKEGLVILSACTLGVVAKPLIDGNLVVAESNLRQLKDTFGEDFYLEIQPHDFDQQYVANPGLIELAQKYGIKLVATTDSHYIYGPKEKDEKDGDNQNTHNALKAISYHKKMGEGGFSIDTNYLMTDDELLSEFDKFDIDKAIVKEALMNTFEVSDKCNVEIKRYKNALPRL